MGHFWPDSVTNEVGVPTDPCPGKGGKGMEMGLKTK